MTFIHDGMAVANYRGCHIAILLPRWQKPPSHPEIMWREFSALTFDNLSEYIFRRYTLVAEVSRKHDLPDVLRSYITALQELHVTFPVSSKSLPSNAFHFTSINTQQ